MRNIYKIISSIVVFLTLVSCEKDNSVHYYYAKYVATALEHTEEFKTVRLKLPNENNLTRFYCKVTFDEEFGWYKSGAILEIGVDEPKGDTYMVRLYIKEKGEKMYHLVAEEFNSIIYKLP